MARQKIWALEGYLLKQRLFDNKAYCNVKQVDEAYKKISEGKAEFITNDKVSEIMQEKISKLNLPKI